MEGCCWPPQSPGAGTKQCLPLVPPGIDHKLPWLDQHGADGKGASRSAFGDLQAAFYGKDFGRGGFEVRVLAVGKIH